MRTTLLSLLLLAAVARAEDPAVVTVLGLSDADAPAGSVVLSAGDLLAPWSRLEGADDAHVVEALRLIGCAAVLPDADDLGLPRGKLAAWSDAAGVPFVSAHFGADDAPLRRFSVHPVGDTRVAVTSVAALGARESAAVPDDVRAALAGLVASMRAAADRTVLVVDGDREEAAALCRAVEGFDLCIHAGRGLLDTRPLAIGGTTLLCGPVRAGQVAHASLAARTATTRLGPPGAGLTGEMRDLMRRAGHPDTRFARRLETSGPPAQDVAAAARPDDAVPLRELPDTKRIPLGWTVSNRGLRLTIHGVTACRRFGVVKAPADRRLLVIDTEWENTIPLSLTMGRNLPTAYRAKNLADHLYLILDGARLLQLEKPYVDAPGHLPTRPLNLADLGSTVRGNVIFEIPAAAPRSLELALYEYNYGPLKAMLLERPDATPAPALAGPAGNALLELGVFDLRAEERDGTRVVALDLRGRSLAVVEAEAARFRPGAEPDEMLTIGSVADWSDWRGHLRLVGPDGVAIPPSGPDTLGDEPRFPPDRHTGGWVRFAVPGPHSDGFVLRVDIPHARVKGAVQVGDPEPFELALPTLPGEPTPAAEQPTPEPAAPEPAPVEEPAAPQPAPEPEPTPAPAPAAPTTRVPKGLTGHGIDGRDVNEAIRRGREALWRMILEEDRELGARYPREHALAVLALLHSEGMGTLPGFGEAAGEFLKTYDPGTRTYTLSVLAMAIDAYGDPALQPVLRVHAQRLLDGQQDDGSWGYQCPREPPLPEPDDDRLRVVNGQPPASAAWREERLERSVPFHETRRNGDNSVSQFAVLGLRAAERRGLILPDAAWEAAAEMYRVRQSEKDGGWSYRTGSSYGSMTCAGICSLAISRHRLGDAAGEDHARIARGLAWLDGNFQVGSNPNKNQHNYYYIYSLERVGRLLDTEFIGDHEWYPLGVRHLLATQREDGLWKGAQHEKNERIATSFALLFLTRATETLDEEPEEVRHGPGRLVTRAPTKPGGAIYVILDASGSMRAEAGDTTRFDAARAALRAMLLGLPDEARVALRVFGHRHFAIHDEANRDTALEVPFGAGGRDAVLQRLASLRPKGKTPLALSLEEAARDVRREPGDVTVLLLTDGREDTLPRRDPMAAADLMRGIDGVDFHLVGLAIENDAWETELRTMAARAGGRYIDAQQAAALAETLEQAVRGVPAGFTLLDADGDVVKQAEFGSSFELPDGKYRLVTRVDDEPVEREFWIGAGRTTTVVIEPR